MKKLATKAAATMITQTSVMEALTHAGVTPYAIDLETAAKTSLTFAFLISGPAQMLATQGAVSQESVLAVRGTASVMQLAETGLIAAQTLTILVVS